MNTTTEYDEAEKGKPRVLVMEYHERDLKNYQNATVHEIWELEELESVYRMVCELWWLGYVGLHRIGLLMRKSLCRTVTRMSACGYCTYF